MKEHFKEIFQSIRNTLRDYFLTAFFILVFIMTYSSAANTLAVRTWSAFAIATMVTCFCILGAIVLSYILEKWWGS